MNPDNQTPQQPPVQEPQTPVTPAPSVAEPAAQPIAQPVAGPVASPVNPVAPEQGGSKALAIWSLTLAIISFVVLLFFFIAGPLAIAALILGIIVLVKRKPGKGLGIAGIAISSLTLISIPFMILITLAAFNGVSDKAKEVQREAEMRETTSQGADSAE